MDINGYWVDYLVDTDDIIHPWHVVPVGTFLLSILPSIRCHWSTPTPPVPIFACLLDCLRKGVVVILKVACLESMEGHQKSQSWPYSCAWQCVQRICPKHFGENIGSLANLLLSAFTREDVQHRDANCHGRLDSNYELFTGQCPDKSSSLVGGWATTLKNDGVRQLGWLFPSLYMEKWNMFQTTNQIIWCQLFISLSNASTKTTPEFPFAWFHPAHYYLNWLFNTPINGGWNGKIMETWWEMKEKYPGGV